MYTHPNYYARAGQQIFPRRRMARYGGIRADSTGNCTLTADGTYNTADDCNKTCGWKYECVTTDNGDKACKKTAKGTYTTEALCDDNCGLLWDCFANATDSDYLCSQVKNGKFESESDCKCRKCSDTAGGPTSKCEFTATDGVFGTLADCKSDQNAKCGWKYKCPS